MKNKTKVMVGLMKWITVCAALAWLPVSASAASLGNRYWSSDGSSVGGDGDWFGTNHWNANGSITSTKYDWDNAVSNTVGYTANIGNNPSVINLGGGNANLYLLQSGNAAGSGRDSTINSGTLTFKNDVTTNSSIINSYGGVLTFDSSVTLRVFTQSGERGWQITTNSGATATTAGYATTVINGNIVSYSGSTVVLNFWNTYGGRTIVNGDIISNDGKAWLDVTLVGSTGTGGYGLGETFYLNGNNTGIAKMSLSRSGTLIVGSNGALGAGALTIGPNAVAGDSITAVLTGTSNLTIANSLTIGLDTTGNIAVGGAHTSGLSSYTANLVLNRNNNDKLFALTQVAGGTTAFTGIISDGATTYSRLLTKTGEGTVVFGSANTYKGGTAIKAGTLLVNNANGLGTGAVTISAGASLGGSGAINAKGGLEWNSDGSGGLLFTLDSTVLNITGEFAGIGSDFNFTFNTDALEKEYTLITFTTTTFDTSAVDYFKANISGDFAWVNNSLIFTVTNIPEPSTLFLLGTGVALLAVLRRRRG